MKRRQFLTGVGTASIGGSALLGSGAFSRVESQRAVTIAVARDPDAYLGMDKCPGTPNSSYAHLDDDGHLALYLNEANPTIGETPLGRGINSNSTSWFDNVFQICNQGKEGVCLWIEDDEDWPRTDDDRRRVEFYLGDDDGTSVIGVDNSVALGVGQCVCIGVRTRSYGLSTGDELLEALDNEVRIIADVDGDCFASPEPVCEACTFETDVTASPAVSVEGTTTGGFPLVSTFLDVDTTAGNAGGLTTNDFSLCEDGCQQDVSVNITGEDKPVDFVFLLDVTGSMGSVIDGLKSDIVDFVDSVETEGIDARYALYLYGDDDSGSPAVFLKQDFTSDSATLTDAVQDVSLGEVVGLGNDLPEDNYEAILTADADLTYRSGSQRVLIDITDAPGEEDPDQMIGGLPETRASAVSVLDSYLYIAVAQNIDGPNEKKTLAEDSEVDGIWIELGTDFDPILSAIETEVASSYRLTYNTTNDSTDGTTREIVVRIDDPDAGTLYATTSYSAPST